MRAKNCNLNPTVSGNATCLWRCRRRRRRRIPTTMTGHDKVVGRGRVVTALSLAVINDQPLLATTTSPLHPQAAPLEQELRGPCVMNPSLPAPPLPAAPNTAPPLPKETGPARARRITDAKRSPVTDPHRRWRGLSIAYFEGRRLCSPLRATGLNRRRTPRASGAAAPHRGAAVGRAPGAQPSGGVTPAAGIAHHSPPPLAPTGSCGAAAGRAITRSGEQPTAAACPR